MGFLKLCLKVAVASLFVGFAIGVNLPSLVPVFFSSVQGLMVIAALPFIAIMVFTFWQLRRAR